MRRRRSSKGLVVNAIAGSHVVFFGLDLAGDKRPGFRGFGFKRFDAATGETIWLRGTKTFEATEPHPAIGETFRSCNQPIQSFQWADYSVKPGQAYRYTIVALYAPVTELEARIEVEIPLTTEPTKGLAQSVFFNRGSVATQEYARRFQNREPGIAGIAAYEWLSRGLVEALIAFIDRATAGCELHVAMYEFQWAALFDPANAADDDPGFAQLDVLHAIKAAVHRGARVRVLFDDIQKYRTSRKTGKKSATGPWTRNRAAIASERIKTECRGRANSSWIMHNKFFVLSEAGVPKAVWTGSTNLTENGLFGHSNLGHIVEDRQVAQAFLDYWHRLSRDPKVDRHYRAANTAVAAVPPSPWNKGTLAIFSPRGSPSHLDALDWYADVAAAARGGLFMTFAFGMNDKFKQVYGADDNVLKMALLDSKGSKRARQGLQKIRNRTNVILAIGNRLVTNAFDRWLAEMDRVTAHVNVQWVHTKYMLVDPLGATPIVVTGSANFSKASTCDNDENMLVIRGDKRVADIYFGEFIRLYSHYAFREAVKWFVEKQRAGKPEQWQPQYLIDDDKWMDPYFDPGDKSARFARRAYFAGPMSGSTRSRTRKRAARP